MDISLDFDAFSVNVESYTIDTNADSDNPAIRRIGSWIGGSVNGAYNNSLIYSNVQGDLARYTFTGDRITYTFSRGPNYGYVSIFIDGALRSYFDLYSPTYIRQQQISFTTIDTSSPLIDQQIPTSNTPNGTINDIEIKPAPTYIPERVYPAPDWLTPTQTGSRPSAQSVTASPVVF